jgi:hypothetical protein
MVLIRSSESNACIFLTAASNDSIITTDIEHRILVGAHDNATLAVSSSNVEVAGFFSATQFLGLPVASTSQAGIVTLSTSTNSTSQVTAATSSAVAALYPASQVVDVATTNQTLLKNGATYVSVRGDTGNVGINKTPETGYALDVNGQIRSTNDITAFSDIRLKKDLVKITGALGKVLLLNGYTFARVDEPSTNKRYVGVIAQEVQAVLPEAVQGNTETGLSVAYGNMVALLIEALKDLTARIVVLETAV